MNIIIGEKYKITSDKMNVVLNERYEKQKNGEPSGEFDFKGIGFYKNLEHACGALMTRELNVSDAENLGELVGIIYETRKIIQEATNVMVNEKVQDLQSEIRSLNAQINSIKALSRKCDQDGRPIEAYELFEILNKEEADS